MSMTLDFTSLPLIGRGNELNLLLKIYNSLSSGDQEVSNPSRRNTVIHGYSGTGKTALVRKFADIALAEGRGRFVSGKCDQLAGTGTNITVPVMASTTTTTMPYKPVIDACNELCRQILDISSSEQLKATRQQLQDALEVGDCNLLSSMIPSMSRLMDCPDLNKSLDYRSGHSPNIHKTKSHLTLSFRRFIRTLATEEHPLVLFLDDLQWADQSSLALLKALCIDSKLKHFLFLGSYRENQVNPELFSYLQELAENETAIVTDISISNLDPASLNTLLSSVLSLPSGKTQSFAFLLYEKTRGNPFFVVQMLRSLQERQILFYSRQTFRWTWDADKIACSQTVSDNVAELVNDRIQNLHPKVGVVLKLAACLGSEFDYDSLAAVVELASSSRSDLPLFRLLASHLEEQKEQDIQLDECLAQAVKLELIMLSTGKWYRFAHDRLQESAYSLIPSGEDRDKLHWLIGETLLKRLDPSKSDLKSVFLAADQLNRVPCGEIIDSPSKVRVAELNLEAGEAAIALAAFEPAIKYLQAGINTLGKERWASHYDLTLLLCQKLASTTLCTGQHKESRILIWEVLESALVLDDKIPSLLTLYESYATEGKLQEAVETTKKVLVDLGEDTLTEVNSKKLDKGIKKTRSILKRMTAAEVLSLPTMAGSHKEAVMQILIATNISELHLGRADSMGYLMSQGLFLEHGVCKHTPTAIVLFGILLILQGEVDEGHRIAMLGVKLGEKRFPDEVAALSWMHVFFHGFADHWRRPLQLGLDGFYRAYEASLKAGAMEQSGFNLIGYYVVYFYGGFKLQPFLFDMQKFGEQLLDYGQKTTFMVLVPYWQCVLNLMGPEFGGQEDPLDMNEGTAIECARKVQRDNTYKLGGTTTKSFLLQLAYYFGNLDLSYKMSCELLADEGTSLTLSARASVFIVTRKFFHGLVRLGLARKATTKTARKKYIREAKEYIRWLKSWSKKGAVNCLHKLQILQAELATIKPRRFGRKRDVCTVKQAFDDSIRASGRSGFRQDHALANELAGQFFLSQPGEEDLSAVYLEEACKIYSSWGAHAKTAELRRRHNAIIGPQGSGVLDAADCCNRRSYSAGNLARERFNPLVSKTKRDLDRAFSEKGKEGKKKGWLF